MNTLCTPPKAETVEALALDLFCGAGGVTTGFRKDPRIRVVAAVNHDSNAILSHRANHRDVFHYTEDIRTLDTQGLVSNLSEARKEHPSAYSILWASCECTNFSKAKGGQSRDADSRTLAEHLFRYIRDVNPDYVQIENVVEFMDWGPLVKKRDKNGLPVLKYSKKLKRKDFVWVMDTSAKGSWFSVWWRHIRRMGYRFEYRILNAADYGARTSRVRLFIQFAKGDLPIAWPDPTCDKKAGTWKPCRPALDLDNKGISIFGRDRPLCDNTLRRIIEGIRKFCPKEGQFFQRYYSGTGHVKSIDTPCDTLTTIPHQYITSCQFISNYYSGGGQLGSLEEPMATLLTNPNSRIVDCQFIDQMWGQSKPSSINAPLGAITTNPHYNIVTVGLESWAPFVKVQDGKVVYLIEPGDTPVMRELKDLMCAYRISDISQRLLTVKESLKIMGFPDDYILMGTVTEQRKFIGNAVEVNMALAIAKSTIDALQHYEKQQITIN